ncbi:MAG: DUF4105 domain-containing protein [Alkalimonas sp.]|nr:DUF4105 domain-containing protein [Alkalimonas sp.]
MHLGRCLKGAVVSVLFLFSAQGGASQLQELSLDPFWQLLLHHNGQRFLVEDPRFYLSSLNQADELVQAVSVFFPEVALSVDDIEVICRFPARYEWLRSRLSLMDRPSAASLCTDYSEFLQRVPAEHISLVYAAENITQPSSMMGHSFLAFRGKNTQNTELAHALTFFTDVDVSRPVDLIWGSLVRGKPGYLVVSPLRQQMAFYLHDEQRNVYEYPVRMNHEQRSLLLAHLWELRQVDIDYYFHRFNCATLTNNLLAFAEPSLLNASASWLSPLDVVKLSYGQGILEAPVLHPSDKWKIREISKALHQHELDRVFRDMYSDGIPVVIPDPSHRFLLVELGMSLAAFDYHSGELSEPAFRKKVDYFSSLDHGDLAHRIELPANRDPLLRANDSQVALSWQNDRRIGLRWLPAAHLVSDNHRHAFSESELQLLSITGSYQPETRSLRLEQATLYAVSSFIPYDKFTGGLSGRFHISMYRQPDALGHSTLIPSVGGGLGASHSIHQDVMFYTLFNAAIEQHRGLYLTAGPEVGVMMYQLFNNKSVISLRHDLNYMGSGKSRHAMRWQQSWFLHQDYTLHFSFEKQRFQGLHHISSALELRLYY